MINWDQYKSEIIAMSEEGLSSTEIVKILSKTHPEVDPHKSRSVRNALQRWREGGDYQAKVNPAKVLLFDIETSPILAYLWSLRQKYISPDRIKQDWFVICWSAKWLFEDEMMSDCVTSEEAKNQDDERVVESLWKLLDRSDVVISHNGNNFDIKKMNGRFIKYGMNLPMPYRSIDTYKAARRRLNLSSLKLDYLAEYLGIDGKHNTDFQLWEDCMDGIPKALNRMSNYCEHDVEILEDVYLHLRPFITSHPNLGLHIQSDVIVCPACGSDDLNPEGSYETNVNIYDAYRCQDCGSITRNRHAKYKEDDKKHITRSVAR